MNQEKYIGMDVHDATISVAVKNAHLQPSPDSHAECGES